MASPHKEIFKNGNRDWKYIPQKMMFVNEKNRLKSPEEMVARVKGLLEKEKDTRLRIKEAGIKYDFPGFVRDIII